MKYIDFHIHTIYSDGIDSPKTIVRAAKFIGLDAITISDHDTMAGYKEALEESKRWDLLVLPNTEISTIKYHILGLNVNPEYIPFQNFLEHCKKTQEKVCNQRVEVLKNNGMPLTLAKIKQEFPKSRLGKGNLVSTMLIDPDCRDYIKTDLGDTNFKKVFDFYVGKEGLAGNVEKVYFISEEEAISQIHLAGGLAILAHPFKDVQDFKEIDRLISFGLDGLEIQPNYGDKNIPFEQYAKEKGLLTSYGSDYHGAYKKNRPLLGREKNVLNKDLENYLNCII